MATKLSCGWFGSADLAGCMPHTRADMGGGPKFPGIFSINLIFNHLILSKRKIKSLHLFEKLLSRSSRSARCAVAQRQPMFTWYNHSKLIDGSVCHWLFGSVTKV